jgi:hypothetical protein
MITRLGRWRPGPDKTSSSDQAQNISPPWNDPPPGGSFFYLEWSGGSIWNGPADRSGMVRRIDLEWSGGSIWNGPADRGESPPPATIGVVGRHEKR